MSPRVFGTKYSKYYDLVYADKNYAKECDYLEKLFLRFSNRPVKSILDIACGTGGHDIPLFMRGYSIEASDISPSMVAIARRKVRASGQSEKISFRISDMRKIRPEGHFDACICMFASIGYILDAEDLIRTLEGVRARLKEQGMLIFDFWYGPAVLNLLPVTRKKTVKNEGLEIIRSTEPTLFLTEEIISIKTRTRILQEGRLIDDFIETHKVRYFFPAQIRKMLETSGFEVLSLHPFMNPAGRAGKTDWNVTAVARKR